MTPYRSRSRSRHQRHDRSDSLSHSHRHHSYGSSHNHHHHHNSYSSSHHGYTKRKVYDHNHRHRNRATSRRHHTSSHSSKPSKKSFNDENEKDDSIGHYQGTVGDIINKQYEIVRELGTGTFARAFEVIDLDSSKHYAMKVVRAVSRYCRHAKIEASIMEDITKRDKEDCSHCGHLIDQFEFNGHYCMVMPLYGPSLYSVIKSNDYRPFPISLIRLVLKDIFESMQFLHNFGLTHTDLKLENILFDRNADLISISNDSQQDISVPNSHHIKVIDFGSATYATDKREGIINTRQYRAPEVLFGLPWDEESDIWGVGCIAMELFTGDLLFQTHDDLLHFALIEKIIGHIPENMINNLSDRKRRYFTSDGSFILEELHHTEQSHVKEQKTLKELIGPKYPNFFDLMESCLIIVPKRRITAAEALMHPFFSGKD